MHLTFHPVWPSEILILAIKREMGEWVRDQTRGSKTRSVRQVRNLTMSQDREASQRPGVLHESWQAREPKGPHV